MKLFDFVFQDTGSKALPLKVWRKTTAGSVALKMPDDVHWVFVRMIGGGGRGGQASGQSGVLHGGGGGGGGCGVYVETALLVTAGATYPCVVGASGGNTSFAGMLAIAGADGGAGQSGVYSDTVGLVFLPIGGRGGGRGNDGRDGGGQHGMGGLGERPANTLVIDGVVLGSGGNGGSSPYGQGSLGVRGFVEIAYRSAGEITEV